MPSSAASRVMLASSRAQAKPVSSMDSRKCLHLVTAQHAADPQRDAGLAAQRIARPLGRGGDLVEFALAGGQQLVALARALRGHQRIAAGDQPFARVGGGAGLGPGPPVATPELE